MRIRQAKFAMIPMWVLSHPEVRGNATRIAVYAGIRAVAWEQPDLEWRSTREIALAVGEVVGVPWETCRKHLSALVLIGAIIKGDEVIDLPDNITGSPSGSPATQSGSEGTQSGVRTTTGEKERKKESLGGSPSDDPEAEEGFDEFYVAYPNKQKRPNALRAWKAARKRRVSAEVIMHGLDHWSKLWTQEGTERKFIPHPATWLNAEQYSDAPPIVVPSLPTDLGYRYEANVHPVDCPGDCGATGWISEPGQPVVRCTGSTPLTVLAERSQPPLVVKPPSEVAQALFDAAVAEGRASLAVG